MKTVYCIRTKNEKNCKEMEKLLRMSENGRDAMNEKCPCRFDKDIVNM